MPFVVIFFSLMLSFVGMSKLFCLLICFFLDEVQVIPMLMFFLWFQVVAIDRKSSCKLMAFQELSSRGRGSKDTSITLDSIKVSYVTVSLTVTPLMIHYLMWGSTPSLCL